MGAKQCDWSINGRACAMTMHSQTVAVKAKYLLIILTHLPFYAIVASPAELAE